MTSLVSVLIQRLDPEIEIPTTAHPGDAGVDLRTTIDFELKPGQRLAVPTGIAIALPAGYVALVHPRSGLALKHGVGMVNAPGTIDAGYRGEIKVILMNFDSGTTFSAQRGERIAQLVFQKFEKPDFVEVSELPGSDRGEGGFGSTGRS